MKTNETWESTTRQVAALADQIEGSEKTFARAKEQVACLGHGIGYRNGHHFIDLSLAGLVWDCEYTDFRKFCLKMAELIICS